MTWTAPRPSTLRSRASPPAAQHTSYRHGASSGGEAALNEEAHQRRIGRRKPARWRPDVGRAGRHVEQPSLTPRIVCRDGPCTAIYGSLSLPWGTSLKEPPWLPPGSLPRTGRTWLGRIRPGPTARGSGGFCIETRPRRADRSKNLRRLGSGQRRTGTRGSAVVRGAIPARAADAVGCPAQRRCADGAEPFRLASDAIGSAAFRGAPTMKIFREATENQTWVTDHETYRTNQIGYEVQLGKTFRAV